LPRQAPRGHNPLIPVPADTRRRAARLTAQIAALGLVLPGTVAGRYTRCGKPGCRCTASPPVLHGPYLTWTRKVAGKTVTRRLTEDQYQAYRPWFEASHTLRALLAELEFPESQPAPKSARRR